MYYKPNPQTVKCQVVAKANCLYKSLVIQDLSNDNYLMLTVFPNWQGLIPEVGDVGFIEFEFAEAGKTEWFNKNLAEFNIYKNTYLVFKQFVKSSEIIENNKIII